MKVTKILSLVIVFCLTLALLVGCAPKTEEVPAATEPAAGETTTEAPAASSNYEISLGVIQPGPEFYYQQLTDAMTLAAEYAGMEVTSLISEYSAEKELANVEDLISQGVDAIIMFSVSGDAAQIAAQVCNEADIPFFTVGGTASDGPGVVTSSIKNDFFEMGQKDGIWLAENFEGEAKIADIQGLLGADIAEAISRGLVDGISSRDDMEVVFQTPADWDRAKAIKITEDLLASDLDFNVIMVHNEDMAAGVVSVLKEAGVLNNGVQVITQNGSPPGFDMIRAGEIMATVSNSSTYVGGDAIVQIMKYLDGMDVEPVWNAPVFAVDATNVDDPNQVTWDMEWATQRVD